MKTGSSVIVPPQYVGVPLALHAVTNRAFVGISYPDGRQDKDGLIRIIYDFDRRGERLILIASFREEDVLLGRTDSKSVCLRQLESKGSGGREAAKT